MSALSDDAELLAALHAAGAASEEDEAALEQMLAEDPDLESMVTEFRDSIVAVASSVEPIEAPGDGLSAIQQRVRAGRSSWTDWFARLFSRKTS